MRERNEGMLHRALLRRAMDVLVWLAAALSVALCLPAGAQVVTTPIADTVYHADGTAAAGTALISWGSFTTASGQSIPQGTTAVTLGTGGALRVSLAANSGATPMGTYYTVVYHLDDGSTSREYWTVPVSSTAVGLSAVRATVLPSSVALQTVTKQYVDQAIAKAALSGVVPTDASPYVVKAGDTMTGPLVLPGDPTSALQAADKNYVDAGTTALTTGLAQKVSLLPAGTQTVTQPVGTQLQTSILNGQIYAKEYVSPALNDGIKNAFASSDCAVAGCTVVADSSYVGSDVFPSGTNGTHLVDQRGGSVVDTFFNPQSITLNNASGHALFSNETQSASARYTLREAPIAIGLEVTQNALAGGNNLYPPYIPGITLPYGKSTYMASQTNGFNWTPGQHVLDVHNQTCYAVGDCLLGAQFLTSSGGLRDDSDEGGHPFDIQIAEDPGVFTGACATGCSTGSTVVKVTATSGASTQGEGRFLIDKAASKTITTGTLTGPISGGPLPSAQFSGTSFPVSTFFALAGSVLAQVGNMAPGTVNAAISTSGVPAGFATNTALAPAGSGVACVADLPNGDNFETGTYTVVDGTHLQLVLNKPHYPGAAVAMGGLCGYGLEQTVDTVNGLRQVFPVVGSPTASSLYYVGLSTQIVGASGLTGGYFNLSAALLSLQRSGNVVTATVSGALPQNVNGLPLTVAGATDSSYNGTFTVTSTASNQFTYAQTGANSSTTGGAVSYVTGGFALYPMAEVLNVYNASTHSVDGTMTLAANTVAWAAGDAVEEPHYFQIKMAGDTSVVTQYLPRPANATFAGVRYGGTVANGVQGWVIQNSAAGSSYFGNGGTHTPPYSALGITGPWQLSMDMQAGDTTALNVRCNSHGCGRWDSAYNLFALQSNAGTDTVRYAPNTSTMTYTLGGTQYSLSPTSLTAGTINVTTLNASHVNGLAASATVDTTNAVNITSGTLDAARLPAGFGASNCASNVSYSATPTFAVTCSNPTFHMPLTGNVTGESFTGLAAGQHITLVFQVGSTAGYTVAWSSLIHGGFVTSSSSGAAGYTQAGKYLVQELVVDTDGASLLNPGAINE